VVHRRRTAAPAVHGISVRLLHQLFSGHERTYGAEVRHRRIEQAYRDLYDPALAGLRVVDIAIDAGFVDVTHFHRAFRQRYGRTPAQVRQAVIVATAELPFSNRASRVPSGRGDDTAAASG
jgi:AraC-like DNA-binding protein